MVQKRLLNDPNLKADANAAGNSGGGRYKLMTKNGYAMLECASALQKSIRRGLEREALFWAQEIETAFPVYVWKRLAIIASEDIGMANPMAAVLVSALCASYMMIRNNSEGKHVDGDILAHAVLYLSRSRKNREVDEFCAVVDARRRLGWRLEVPDFALDKHTEAGRRAGKDITDFWTEGAKLSPEVGGSDYWREAQELTAGRVVAEKTDGGIRPGSEPVP